MEELTGISAAPGIAIGKAFVYVTDEISVPRYAVTAAEVDGELKRYQSAAAAAREELVDLKRRSEGEVSPEQLAVIDAHLLMADDQGLAEDVGERLKATLMNVEWVLYQGVQKLIAALDSSDDPYLRERTSDLRDVTGRIFDHLLLRKRNSLADLAEEVVLIARDLMPSDAIGMNKHLVRGIAMDAGGRTSHTAILARSFEIPSVLGLSTITRHVRDGDLIIVDGNHGCVVVDPDAETLARYQEESQEWQRHEVQLMAMHDLASETKDGKLINLKGNIEVPDEVEAVLAHGGDGIGLYRSEFLFLGTGRLPGEEEQYNAYSTVLKAIPDKPVTIRTLDLGGDKVLPTFDGIDEKNPILGWRAIRFCLTNRDIFRTQLRALLRASVHGELKVMFPMISGLEELLDALTVVKEVTADLQKEGVDFQRDIPVGIMIEVPSAAMVSDILARKSRFFSVGTNDLIQYTIAVDRGNEKIAYLYEPFHPGVLRMLRLIADNAHDNGIAVAMCGEMAGDPLATVLLLGLGYDELSMSAGGIPQIKKLIRSVSIREAEELVGEAMELRSFKEVDRFLRHHMEERFGVVTN